MSQNKGKDIRIKSTSRYETLFPDFYFSSAENGWLCKTCNSFAHGPAGNRAFIDKPGNVGDHPTERFTDHLKSKRHLISVKNKQGYIEMSKRNTNVWQLATDAVLSNASSLRSKN